MATTHDKTAARIARQKGTKYNQGPGPDVKAGSQTIEVETRYTVSDAARQLSGFRGPVYVAGSDPEATRRALEHYEGTTIGVMSPSGRILKRSTRRRKS